MLTIAKTKPRNESGQERLAVSQIEAAQMLGVSITTLKRWMDQGKIPYRKVNRRVLFSVDVLRRFAAGETEQE